MNDILNSKTEKEIIKPEHYNEYKVNMKFFHNELTMLNSTTFIMNKILEFPFDIFCKNPDDRTFFYIVIRNFYDYSLIKISRLFKDSDDKTYNLRKFIDKMIPKYIKLEYQKNFIPRIKKLKSNKLLASNILKRVYKLRNNIIAHSVKEFVDNPEIIKHINFNELKKLKDYSNQLFSCLFFDITYNTIFIPYNEEIPNHRNYDSRSDIVKILDCVAKESPILKTPERYKFPSVSNSIISEWSNETLNTINKYRKKFGYTKITR